MITVRCLAQCSAEVSVNRGRLSGLHQGQVHGIRSGDYHSSVRETTAMLVLWDYTNYWRPARPTTQLPSCFLQVHRSSDRHSLLSSSVGEDRVRGADSVSLQECECDTDSVLVMLRVSTWHQIETLWQTHKEPGDTAELNPTKHFLLSCNETRTMSSLESAVL